MDFTTKAVIAMNVTLVDIDGRTNAMKIVYYPSSLL
jgi:hypothetical protein